MSVTKTTLLAGALGSLAAMAAAGLLSRREGARGWQPINASSHWYWDDEEAAIDRPDPTVTPLGIGTNVLAGLFWGGVLAMRLKQNPPQEPLDVVREAGLVTAAAGILDYGILPRRLSPGWELGLPWGSVVASLGAMAIGLAGGALAAGPWTDAEEERNYLPDDGLPEEPANLGSGEDLNHGRRP